MACISKKEHNRRNYLKDTPYPVRLGILKEIIQEDSVLRDISGHACILFALETFYSPQLDERAVIAASSYDEVKRLLKLDYTLAEAMEELRLNSKLFLRGLDDVQRKELEMLIRRSEQRLWQLQHPDSKEQLGLFE